MSHTALRRVMIRLLHDPELLRALAADPDRALAGVELTAAERRALLATPPAAWRTDPDRPARVRAALADEFPAATALAPALADRFFASPHFHGAVQGRGSLALAYGAHLASHPDSRIADVARLETAIARLRRAPRRPDHSRDGRLRLSPHAAIVQTERGASAALAAARTGAPPPPGAAGREHVLVVRDGASGEITLEELSPDLASLLDAAATEVPRASLVELAVRLGGDEAESAATVAGLEADGLLV
jgi:hypothetical protein